MQIKVLGWAKVAIAGLTLLGPAIGIIYEAGRYADSVDRAVLSLTSSQKHDEDEINSIVQEIKSLEEQRIHEQDAIRELLHRDGLDEPMDMHHAPKSQVRIPQSSADASPQSAVPNTFESIMGGLNK